jgi:hypothetical protein
MEYRVEGERGTFCKVIPVGSPRDTFVVGRGGALALVEAYAHGWFAK